MRVCAGAFTIAAMLTAGRVTVGAADADPDVARAFAAARTRAAAGDPVAQFSIGSLLYYGGGSLGEAVEWIRKAAVQGYAPAEFQLAQLYDFGFGVMQDVTEAFSWYRTAAEHGDAAAARAVGDCYRRGRGTSESGAEALPWYERAAAKGDLRAQYQLGQMYFDGVAVARDYISAYAWFDLAARQTPLLDNQKAIFELRNIAAARMTPEQTAEAARRAAAWAAK